MKAFLMRLLGTSPRQREAERKYLENLKELEDRGEELDRLAEQLEDVRTAAEGKKQALATSNASFTATMTRSLTPPQMRAVLEDLHEDPNDTGEFQPAG